MRTHTLSRYRELLKRVNAGIGHLKICDIRPQHLNQFYEQLAKEGIRKNASKAVILPGVSLSDIIHAHGFSNVEKFLKEKAAISVGTYKQATRGERISGGSARKIAAALEMDVSELFKLETDLRPLSPKTVREHHVLIHVILHHAEREMLIPYNPADKAQPPKVTRTKADYFQQETVTAILQAAETEPLKWKTLLHLMLVTGGRRGEVLGLTWDCIDFVFKRIYIEKAVYYSRSRGIYVDKVKTDSSIRWIRLPDETMQLLKQYHDEYYEPLRTAAGDQWQGENFLFVQDSGQNIGKSMHPDSVTDFCTKFSERHGLPHIHPHAFRHTAASLLYFAGLDSVSISNMLGHAKVSTTQDIYSHIIAESQNRAAAAMGEVLLTTRKPLKKLDSEKSTDDSDKATG